MDKYGNVLGEYPHFQPVSRPFHDVTPGVSTDRCWDRINLTGTPVDKKIHRAGRGVGIDSTYPEPSQGRQHVLLRHERTDHQADGTL